jgi:MFS family permease
MLTAVSGAARGFWSLAVPRAFIGVGESILTPTSMSMLADRFPSERLGFASGFYYMGVPIGAGASLLIAGYLGPAIGWRNCFYILGVIGTTLAIVMLFVKETPRRGIAASAARPTLREIFVTSWRALKSSPALLYTVSAGVTMHFVIGAATFDQLWYVQERGFERAEIARISGWLGLVGGVLGNLAGGLGGDWLLKRTGVGRPMFMFWVALILAPFLIAYRIVDGGSIWFFVGIFLGFFQLGCFYGPAFSTVQELVPPQIRATIVAFSILTYNLIGLGFGITVGGFLLDYLIDAGVTHPFSKTLLAFTFISLTCIPLFYLAGRRFQGDRARLHAALSAA